jgi:lysozyme
MWITAALGLCLTTACAPAGNSLNLSSTVGSDDQNTESQPSTGEPNDPTGPSIPVIPARPSNAANLKVCPGDNAELGVDVSGYDPGTSWPTLKSGGHSYAFIKASEGITYINPLFAGDWAAAKTAGVLRGAYHYFHADDDPVKQATTFLHTIGELGANDLPAVLDWESSDNQTIATQISRAKTWLQLVEAATGRIPIIYVSTSFFNELGNPQGFERYPLFLAEYGVSCPKVPPPWSTWTFWQYSDQGSVTGIKTSDVDHDLFNGTLAQLMQFINTGTF